MKVFTKQGFWVCLVFILTISSNHGQTKSSSQATTDKFSSLRKGNLSNGLSYYIKDIKEAPEIALNLYVKVGYYNENLESREFSHIIEHLAFKATKSSPENLKQKLNKYGIRVSATTGNRKTNYKLKINSNKIDTLSQGLLWFRDLFDLKLTHNNITKEKEVLKQEVLYRVGDNLNEYYLRTNLLAKLTPCINPFKNHSYFTEFINGFNTRNLIDYYKKWYRPEHTAIIIAGDISNVDELENRIQKLFSNIPGNKNTSSGEEYDCRRNYLQSSNKFITFANKQNKDPHLKSTEVRLNLFYRDQKFLKHKEDGNREFLWSIINLMIAQRIEKRQMWEVSTIPPNYTKPYFNVVISTTDGSEQNTLEEFTQLIQQIKIHGFLEDERKTAQSKLDQQNLNLIQLWVKEMEDNFLNNNPLPDKFIKGYDQKFKTLSLDQINDFAKQNLSTIPNDIGLIAPIGNKALSYSESEIRGWIKRAAETSTTPFVIPQEKELLNLTEISGLKAIGYQSNNINKIGVEELLLNNGVRVVLHYNKLSGFHENQLSIIGFSPKGTLCIPKSDYFSAINAPLIVKTAGIGKLTGKELQFLESQNNLSLNTYIHPTETGIKIKGPGNNILKMFQLLYLSFTQPKNPNNLDFEIWKKVERNRYINPYRDSRVMDFQEQISEVLNNKSMILKHGSTKRFQGIPKTNKARAFEVYRQLYGNARDFTFIISGNFSRDSIIPLIQKYIGNLPIKKGSAHSSNFNPRIKFQVKLPKRPFYKKFNIDYQRVTYNKTDNTYYMLYFISKAREDQNWKEQTKITFLGKLLNKKIINFKYKKNAALYNFNAFGTFDKYLKSYKVGIFLDCATNEFLWLQEESRQLIELIKENGFRSEDFSSVKKEMIKMYEESKTGIKTYSTSDVYQFYNNSNNLTTNKNRLNFVRSLNKEDLLETARKYLKNDKMMEFVM